jgi:vesicle-fusing ATPase
MRHTSLQDMSHVVDEDKIRVTRADFDKAVSDVKPAFGVDNETIQTLMPQPFIVWSDEYQALLNQMQVYMTQVASSPVTRLVTCLVQGPRGCGKTGLAARITKLCPFPFIKVISPETLIGMPESAVSAALNKVFIDAYRSPTALIILDSIERLISYSRVGPIYQNSALQALLTLSKSLMQRCLSIDTNPDLVSKVPPKTRLMVLATSSEPKAMDHLGITDCFHVHYDVPLIKLDEQTKTIREVLMMLETERQELGAEAYKRRCEKLGPPFQALHDLE